MCLRRVAAIVLIVLAVTHVGHASAGIQQSASAAGRTINVSAQMQGRYNSSLPSSTGSSCPDGGTRVTMPASGDVVGPETAIPGAPTRETNGVTERLYITQCVSAGFAQASGVSAAADLFWVRTPQPAELVPDLLAFTEDLLDEPLMTWPSADPEYGWLYVNAAMDFRVQNLAAITVEATVTAPTGESASASVTATPDAVIFESGEPGGGGTACGVDDAAAPYSNEVIGACSYTYSKSSAWGPDGRTFPASVAAEWDISSSVAGAALPSSLTTSTDDPVAVAEVQALVTCTGSRPEQGGC